MNISQVNEFFKNKSELIGNKMAELDTQSSLQEEMHNNENRLSRANQAKNLQTRQKNLESDERFNKKKTSNFLKSKGRVEKDLVRLKANPLDSSDENEKEESKKELEEYIQKIEGANVKGKEIQAKKELLQEHDKFIHDNMIDEKGITELKTTIRVQQHKIQMCQLRIQKLECKIQENDMKIQKAQNEMLSEIKKGFLG